MGRLLHIIASSRGEESNTLKVSEVFLQTFQETHPEWIIDFLLPGLLCKGQSSAHCIPKKELAPGARSC